MLRTIARAFGLPFDTTRDRTDESIVWCPWKEDINIERSSFISSGEYGSIKGEECHTVSCSADGPNSDGTTFHRGSIGHWGDFPSFEEANAFALTLWLKIKELTGVEVRVYASGKDKNAHAKWCMHGRKTRPRGIHPQDLPRDFEAYSY